MSRLYTCSIGEGLRIQGGNSGEYNENTNLMGNDERRYPSNIQVVKPMEPTVEKINNSPIINVTINIDSNTGLLQLQYIKEILQSL